MSKFEDHLWREFVREHGNVLTQMSTPTAKHVWRGPRLVVGTSLGLAGVGAAVALVLGATTTSTAFAVTRNHDGTVTISIERASGIAGANAKLHRLGIRAQVMQHPPTGCRGTLTASQRIKGAPAPGQAARASQSAGREPSRWTANAHWTIDPRKVRSGQTLALTPPPPPPGGNRGNSGSSGNSGNSGSSGNGGNSGSDGQVWSCGMEGAGSGGPPPAPPQSNSGNSGNS
jgi:uncharacterized membrane protein YgcG